MRGEGARSADEEQPSKPLIPIVVAVVALLVFLVLAVGDIVTTAPTTDEPVHLSAAWSYAKTGDYRLNPEHPPLLKHLAAIPIRSLWPAELRQTTDDTSVASTKLSDAWRDSLQNPMAQWDFGHELFFGLRDRYRSALTTEILPREAFVNDADAAFTRARFAMLAVALLLAALLFAWGFELWGWWGGAVAVVLFALDPTFLAHSGLVTTDVGAAALMFGAIYFFWRSCRSATPLNIAGFAILFALAQVAKFSALLLLPMVLVLAIQQLVTKAVRPRDLALVLGIGAVTTILVIWASYGFRYAATPEQPREIVRVVDDWYATKALLPQYPQGPPDNVLRRAAASTPRGALGSIILKANDLHLLPEGYLYGLALVQRSAVVRYGYLRGEGSYRGFTSYFLWTFLYKTPLAALIAIVLALMLLRRERWFLLAPVAIYLLTSMASSLNLGHRHILPIYPFLYIACGALVAPWVRLDTRKRAVVAVIAILALAAPPLLTRERHLSYMNTFAGGPERGWEKLSDSNHDWGQDLERLGEWVRATGLREPINLAYSGSADPRFYGIPYVNLQYGYWAEPQLPVDSMRVPGYLAISTTALAGITSPDGKRDFWRRWIAEHGATRVGSAGYGIQIYRVEGRGR